MALVPVRQTASGVSAATAKSVGQAVTPDGNATVQTTRVSNALTSKKKLDMTLAVAGASAIQNVIVFPGAWRTQAELIIKTGVTFAAAKFTTFESMAQFFRAISTNIYGITISTDNPANFQKKIVFTEKDPTGEDHVVEIDLKPYRVQVGNGYGETIEITESDLNFVKWSALEVMFSEILAGSSIDVSFMVRGWNKSQELSALQSNIIA